MKKHIPFPDKAGLRQFGLLLALILAVIFGVIPIFWLGRPPLLPVMVIVAILFIWSLLLPKTLAPLYRVWMAIGEVLGWINTRIILGILFIAVFFPVGLLMRLFATDPMRRRYETKLTSYRKPCGALAPNHFERPY